MPATPEKGNRDPVVVVMAGGKGERFWPLSRQNNPKQFLRLSGDSTLLEETVSRVMDKVPPEMIFIVTCREHRERVDSLLPRIPKDNIIVEPFARDTAACAGLAAVMVAKQHPNDPPILLMPSDHIVKNRSAFLEVLDKAVSLAVETDCLVTVGIRPDRPHTGFGYIKMGKPFERYAYSVECFIEKPDRNTAERFLKEGSYLWNSGIFAWRPSVILKEISLHMPEMARCLDMVRNGSGWEGAYGELERKSIDYGIMEKASRVLVIPADFGWDDVGSWGAIARHGTSASGAYEFSEEISALGGNMVRKNSQTVLLECSGCMVLPSERLVAGLGLEDLIIVDTEDAILILRRDQEQRVKELLAELRAKGLTRYL